jgi:putative redox protein
MDEFIEADGIRLAAHWARPTGSGRVPGLVLSHGFPLPPRGQVASGITFPDLADRIARDAGWAVLTFNFRGTGGSDGDFSLDGWRRDQAAAIDAMLARPDINGVWLVGSGVGGTLSICTAADDARVRGVATLAAPSGISRWTDDPVGFLEEARRLGVFRDPEAPHDMAAWTDELMRLDALACARALAPRPLLIVHGSDDPVVSPTEAVELASAHGAADLRFVIHGGHRIRHDPRGVATLLGWLDRQVLPFGAADREPSPAA